MNNTAQMIDVTGAVTASKYLCTPVVDSKGVRIPNLVRRNGAYYVQVTVKGKRFLRASPYDQLGQSATWCRKFCQEARAMRWEALEGVKAKSAYPKLADVFTAYREAGRAQYLVDGKPAPTTIENNIGALRTIIQQTRSVLAIDNLGVEDLTRELVIAYLDKTVSTAGADLQMQRRRRVSAASTVRQAKSIFTRWARGYYDAAGMRLPATLDGFMRAGKGVKRDKYQIPPLELRQATATGAAELKAKGQHGLYACYCLAYNLGMRAGEMVNCKWEWFEQDAAGNRFLNICMRSDWQPKNRKARRIPVTPEVWADLQAARGSDDYVLPGGNKTNRKTLINRTFAAWMRQIGWNVVTYPKAAHELRKLAGSRWYSKAGLQWAATWLGDVTDTVYHYYADADELGPTVAM